MKETVITGKAWVGGDDIYAFNIIPQKRWNFDYLSEEELGRWAMEGVVPSFENKEWAMRDAGYSIIIAGKNFGGGGKSIEHPVFALKGAGVKVVIADSFARYNYRNSVNNALPVIVCESMNQMVKEGDDVTVDLARGVVINNTTGARKEFMPLSQYAMDLIDAGGLIPYTQEKLQK
jgi:3-isopropylmalate/(R)-2-methylmalate dehydratase small subunit